jgi:hypothetical protein
LLGSKKATFQYISKCKTIDPTIQFSDQVPISVTSKKNFSLCLHRKSQGKQKGEGNRIKIYKNSDKTRVVGFFWFSFLLNRLFSGVKCESILKMLEEIEISNFRKTKGFHVFFWIIIIFWWFLGSSSSSKIKKATEPQPKTGSLFDSF